MPLCFMELQVVDTTFSRFTYQVVVPKALAPKDLIKVFESKEAVVLPLWDPMVSLLYLYSHPKLGLRVLWPECTYIMRLL